ncbi:hypothetical protein [Streptomyces sp. 6N223]|uniref:hypothetical protein n=1 Tax=Streptomyces sp. 6N223 TaxID=3457412 RepID=UPI003FCF8216
MNHHTTLAGDDWAGVVGAGFGVAGFFALLIVIVWQTAATWRARMLAAREEEYKKLAFKYAELLEDNTEILRRYTDELADTRKAVTSIERMMREVE